MRRAGVEPSRENALNQMCALGDCFSENVATPTASVSREDVIPNLGIDTNRLAEMGTRISPSRGIVQPVDGMHVAQQLTNERGQISVSATPLPMPNSTARQRMRDEEKRNGSQMDVETGESDTDGKGRKRKRSAVDMLEMGMICGRQKMGDCASVRR